MILRLQFFYEFGRYELDKLAETGRNKPKIIKYVTYLLFFYKNSK